MGWVDPLGLEVDAVFNKRTGLLTIVDRETKQVITGKFHSGNGTPDPKQPGASIPSSQYNILEHGQNSDFFRLEPIDKNYGDDTHEATRRNLFRYWPGAQSLGLVGFPKYVRPGHHIRRRAKVCRFGLRGRWR